MFSFYEVLISSFQVLIGTAGVLGNIFLIIWFNNKTNNFHQLMSVLAICDIFYIIMSILIFGLPNIFER